MSEVAIFEFDSLLTVEAIQQRLRVVGIPCDVSRLSERELKKPNYAQSKPVEVVVLVYESLGKGEEVIREITRLAKILLELSEDEEIYYYRSRHAQEKDAEPVFISVNELAKFPPWMGETYTKRYVIRRQRPRSE